MDSGFGKAQLDFGNRKIKDGDPYLSLEGSLNVENFEGIGNNFDRAVSNSLGYRGSRKSLQTDNSLNTISYLDGVAISYFLEGSSLRFRIELLDLPNDLQRVEVSSKCLTRRLQEEFSKTDLRFDNLSASLYGEDMSLVEYSSKDIDDFLSEVIPD